ncbi:MAG: tryptophan--tRNA ligase, partial [Nanoarchaeota archaeon]
MERIDPWGSIDIKDYGKLSKEFGIKPFKEILFRIKKPSLYMRRNIIYGHKDFWIILDAINKKQKFAMLTGLMPSGKFHLGHKVIADQIIYYQR